MSKNSAFIIKGLGGERTLSGEIYIKGAKNSALKAMAAAVLFDGPVILGNVPASADVITMTEVLTKLGAKVEREKKFGNIIIDPTGINSTDIDPKLAEEMRSSVVLTGPMLARYGKVSFPAPGGCVIGARPIDLFLSGYEKLGATIETGEDCIHNIKGTLRGAEINFKKKTVGGTETLMMAATLANGTTTLTNCAMEPEIRNVAEWLNACGADIKGLGTETLVINGTGGKLLSANGRSFTTIPDRIEAGSFLLLGALCAKELTIRDCRPDHMGALVELLKASGVNVETFDTCIKVRSDKASAESVYKAFHIRTSEYPGFPTDLQSPVVSFLTQTQGESDVVETIFEGRFKYVEDLKNIGANIEIINPTEVKVIGPTSLKGSNDSSKPTELKAHDIRAGFAVVMAALVGEGYFKINNVQLIDRGYENLEGRLSSLGADIKRV